MNKLIPAIVLAATAVTAQAETVTIIPGTPMDFFECRELILNLGGYPERRAGAEFFRKDNKFIQVECPAPSEGVKWKPGKVVVYTPAEVAQLEEAHVIKQRRSAEQEAIQKAELLKKYGI